MKSLIKPQVVYAADEPISGGDSATEASHEEERLISVSEAGRLRERNNHLERQVEELLKANKKHQQAQLSEAERLKEERDEALKRSEELETRIRHNERASLISTAASKAGFVDPHDSVRLASKEDLERVESAQDAEKLVAKYAKSKPYLLVAEKPPAELEAVLREGLPATAGVKPNGQTTENDLRQREGSAILSAIREAQGR